MKTVLKSTFTYGLILTGLLFSCKNQDGYSDDIQTVHNPIDTVKTTTDSITVNTTGPDGNSAIEGTGDKGAGNTGAESANAGNTTSAAATPGNTESNGTGTGSGPGPSPKDGSAYAGSSDPQNDAVKTTDKSKKKTTPKK